MDEKKPWDTYESDDPVVQAEKAKTKKLKMRPPLAPKPAPPKKKEPTTITEAYDQASKLAKRNKALAKMTENIRD